MWRPALRLAVLGVKGTPRSAAGSGPCPPRSENSLSGEVPEEIR
jgi:hypothetical protein